MARIKDESLKIKILEAALDMTAEPDFLNFTTSKIAKAAGVSEGTLYNYFDNKEHLVQCLFEYSFNLYFKTLQEYIANESDIREKIRKILSYHIHYFSQSNKIFRLIFRANDVLANPFQIINEIVPLYKKFISEILDEHKSELNENVNSDFTASFILGSVQILVLQETVFPGKIDLNDAIKHLFGMLSKYLFKEEK